MVEDIAIIAARDGDIVLIHGGLAKAAIVDQDDLMMRRAFVSEDALQRPQVNEVGDLGVDFFADFAGDGLRAAFAKFDAAADGAVEGLPFARVVTLGDEDLVPPAEDAERERPDAAFFLRHFKPAPDPLPPRRLGETRITLLVKR